jgi:hypothetical protein
VHGWLNSSVPNGAEWKPGAPIGMQPNPGGRVNLLEDRMINTLLKQTDDCPSPSPSEEHELLEATTVKLSGIDTLRTPQRSHYSLQSLFGTHGEEPSQELGGPHLNSTLVQPSSPTGLRLLYISSESSSDSDVNSLIN